MRKGSLDLLLALLEKGASGDAVKISTSELAGLMSISQQSASRWLDELEEEGLVERVGRKTLIAEKGLSELKKAFAVLSEEFGSAGKKLVFEGSVFSGMRDGQYYLSQEKYKKQFKEKLGFTPFPGTLNLKMKNARSRMGNGLVVEGFAEGERVFGKIFAFPAKINGRIRGAVIVPERTHYGSDVLEIVAKENLREKLKVKDGSIVRVELEK
ncbi:DUF120 domain-containing protein [Candidatus Micrarchaeota archaeon]|nr:DUF120 domain-containing protein [Candidatus Micrarchaeota archaeon]